MTTEALRYLDDLGQRARMAVQQSEQMAEAIERYRHTHNIPRMAVFGRPYQPTPGKTAMLGHLLRRLRHLQILESNLMNDHYIAGKALGLEGICPVCNQVSPVNSPPGCSHMEETQTDREESITNTAPQNPSGPEGGAEAWLEIQQKLLSPVETVGRGGDAFRAMGIALHHIGAATLQFKMIQENPGPTYGGCPNDYRYLWAEAHARRAHSLLHRVHAQLSQNQEMGPEIRKSCRMANLLLTQERAAAAGALGIKPPPRVSIDINHDEIDHHREV